jgi:hypothetical protein
MAKVLNLTAGSGVAGGQGERRVFSVNWRGRIYAQLWAKVPAADLRSRFEPMTRTFVERRGAGWAIVWTPLLLGNAAAGSTATG